MKTHSKRLRSFPDHFFAGLNARVQELRAQATDVIRLDVGSPDLPPSPEIIQALAQSAANPGNHGYQPYLGPHELRKAWAEMYQRLYQVQLDPETEIIPLMGSKEGIFNLVMASIDPGEVALIPDPGYITYDRATRFAGGDPLYLPLLEENDFLPELVDVPEHLLNRAKLLWLNYPNNPTAATIDLDFFNQAVAFARQYDLLVCHDAAYSQVTYDGYHAPSIMQVSSAKDVAVEFNTLSKSHNMAGWRTGVAVGNPNALQSLYTLKTNVDSGQFLPIMEAATVALTGDQSWLVERNEIYQERRDLVIEALHDVGLKARVPKGSLYIWSPVPEGWSSEDFTSMLLDLAHVSLTPGSIFGEHGEGFVRISMTAPLPRIEEAMQRMSWVLQST